MNKSLFYQGGEGLGMAGEAGDGESQTKKITLS